MRIVRHWRHVDKHARGAVVGIGNFDGVHLGHRAVIAAAADVARATGRPLGVLTFEPHPREVLGRVDHPFRLTPFRAKTEAIAALGVDILYAARFDAAFAALEPEAFVREVIIAGLGASHVVIGYDFAFGRKRGGNIDLLRHMADDGGYLVSQIDKAQDEEGAFSASEARRYLGDGDVAGAARILGRPWEVVGRVRSGARIGRTMGFPTANLAVERLFRPSPGIYAVWAGVQRAGAHWDTEPDWHPAAAYLGRRPTFDKTEELLEAHLLDFAGDIYGRRLRIAFVEHIRGDRKFDGMEDLKAQIDKDCIRAREILSATQPPAGATKLNAAQAGATKQAQS